MDKKSLNDRNKKSAKSFKYKRNQLHNKKTSQTLRKEAKEGKTYETSVGLNLDTLVHQPSPTAYPEIEHFLKNISQNELHVQEYEKMVPPYSAKPNPETLSYDPTSLYSLYSTVYKFSQSKFYQQVMLVLEPHESTSFLLKILMVKDNYLKKTNQLRRCPLVKRYRNFWPSLLVHTRKNLTHF